MNCLQRRKTLSITGSYYQILRNTLYVFLLARPLMHQVSFLTNNRSQLYAKEETVGEREPSTCVIATVHCHQLVNVFAKRMDSELS